MATDIDYFKAAGNIYSDIAGQNQRRLEFLAQQDAYQDKLRMVAEQAEYERRQKEKEAYAKWEREQILNSVADDKLDAKLKSGELDMAGYMLEQNRRAAQESLRRGQGGYAREFMASAEDINAKVQQQKALAEKQKQETELFNMRLAEEKRKAEAAKMGGDRQTYQVTDASGTVRLIDRSTGEVVKEIPKAGKPSATFEKTAAAKKKTSEDLDFTITQLERAVADNGLIDKSTGSGIGYIVDEAAAVFGKATPGSIAVGELKPIFDLVLKMVPRFEGPQSDKDTQSYREAAGEIANPAVPNERKKAAAKKILTLMKARKGQFINEDVRGTEVDSGEEGSQPIVVDW